MINCNTLSNKAENYHNFIWVIIVKYNEPLNCINTHIGGTEVAAVVGILKSRGKIQRRVGPTEAEILR